MFRAFVLPCRRLDLFEREVLAVSGARLKAANDCERNFKKAKLDKYMGPAAERLEKHHPQLDDADRGEEVGTTRRGDALKIAKVRD